MTHDEPQASRTATLLDLSHRLQDYVASLQLGVEQPPADAADLDVLFCAHCGGVAGDRPVQCRGRGELLHVQCIAAVCVTCAAPMCEYCIEGEERAFIECWNCADPGDRLRAALHFPRAETA